MSDPKQEEPDNEFQSFEGGERFSEEQAAESFRFLGQITDAIINRYFGWKDDTPITHEILEQANIDAFWFATAAIDTSLNGRDIFVSYTVDKDIEVNAGVSAARVMSAALRRSYSGDYRTLADEITGVASLIEAAMPLLDRVSTQIAEEAGIEITEVNPKEVDDYKLMLALRRLATIISLNPVPPESENEG